MTLLFKDLLVENDAMLKSNMTWQNYNLNNVTIPVENLVKEHALMVLSKSYGMFHVEQDILDPLTADIFIYFPILLQQLAITRLIDAFGVVKDDIDTQETVRTEILNGETSQTSEQNVESNSGNTRTTNMEQKNTGTVVIDNSATNAQTTETDIVNTSNVAQTGGRGVNFSHSMPEQGITGTNSFPSDDEGTPILSAVFVQSAAQNFQTANPVDTSENSTQNTTNNVTTSEDSTTTNDLTSKDTGTVADSGTATGTDVSESTTNTDTTNTINEMITNTTTNKQYAYEIKAFLETADSLIAFKKWENNFGWVIGII